MGPKFLGKWLPIGLLALPAAEIATFLLVAQWLGLQGALFLLVASSLIGAGVLWYVGRIVIQRFVRLLAERQGAAVEVGTGGLFTVLGGILLVLPGFLTDAIGLILVTPPARRLIARHFRERKRRQRQTEPGVINLDSSEWHQVSERKPRPKRIKPPRG